MQPHDALISSLHSQGGSPVFFSFDHRVMDGMAGAQAVQALEHMLHGPVLAELQACATPG